MQKGVAQTQFEFSTHLLSLLQDHLGLAEICLAPGSRNAPLTLAAAHHPIPKTVYYEERSLAFYALGRAKALRKPVAICCTSGSAVSNFIPALTEAFYARVPLIVLSADRPERLRGIQANQTVDHLGLLQSVVSFQVDCEGSLKTNNLSELFSSVSSAKEMIESCNQPIHFNLPFEEPLVPESFDLPVEKVSGPLSKTGGKLEPESSLQPSEAIQIVQKAVRGLVIVGSLAQLHPTLEKHLVSLGWPIIVDCLGAGGLRKGSLLFPLETGLEQVQPPEPPPECILQIGTRLTSKRIQHDIKNAKSHIVLSEYPGTDNPTGTTTHQWVGNFDTFFNALNSTQTAPEKNWQQALKERAENLQNKHEEALKAQKELSEQKAIQTLLKRLPENSTLMVSNSTPIRQVNQEIKIITEKGHTIHANRGASGIDGILATAAGLSRPNKPIHLLIGDMAFAYDIASLGLLKTNPVTVWVIQNKGGQLFKKLPIYQNLDPKLYDTYFAVNPNLNIDALARSVEVGYSAVTSIGELKTQIQQEAKHSRVVEIKTQ